MKKIVFILLYLISFTLFAGNNKVDKTKEAKVRELMNNQPLEFIENKGQFCNTEGKPADNVFFKASYGNCDIYITDKGLSYVFVKLEEDGKPKTEDLKEERKGPKTILDKRENKNLIVSYYRLDMNLEGANISSKNIIKEDESKQGYSNYFYAHCPEGIYNVKAYGKITIKNIYQGIDWVIYTNTGSKEQPLKYDFVIHPKADYKDIRIKFTNADSLGLYDNNSKLKIHTIAGIIEEGNLYSYQTNNKDEIQSKYIIGKDSAISFEIAAYDTSKTLVIDPLVWATFYSNNTGEPFTSIVTDNRNNLYITGHTVKTNFPTLQLSGAYWQAALNGVYYDVVIIKFNINCIRLWATYYGGSESDFSWAMCSDSQDNIYLSGTTSSTNFPTQQLSGAFWQASNGGSNIFILKFDSAGIRQWATYYGTDGSNISYSICADRLDNIYITGATNSPNFPTQQLTGAYWQALKSGNTDLFIIKFNNLGVRQWATYYGGTNSENLTSMCSDSQNNIYMTGYTWSSDFPKQQLSGAYWQPTLGSSPNFTTFILKFNNLGVRQWATYYGGSHADRAYSICSDNHDNIYLTGETFSTDLPLQQLPGAYWQPTNNAAGSSTCFILKFDNLGVRQWATYLGGSGAGFHSETAYTIKCDKKNNIYVTGRTLGLNFPTQQIACEYFLQAFTNFYTTFITRFDSIGVINWSTLYNAYYGNAIAVNNKNSVYFTGSATDSTAYLINPGNGAYFNSGSAIMQDNFIIKVDTCNVRNITSLSTNRNNICANDNGFITLTVHGGSGDTLKWYTGGCGQNCIGYDTVLTIPSPTQTITYYARWESCCRLSACDSIKINVQPIYTINLNPFICQGQSYQVGSHFYTVSGVYIDSLATVNGCDSIITTNLTVTGIYKTIHPVICQGEAFQLDTITYTIAGTYNQTFWSSMGCDSMITINLSVKPSPSINLGNDTNICKGTHIILNASYPNSTFQWQDNSTNPTFVVNQRGLYWVKATMDSCIAMDSIIINTINCPSILELPNIITPNNDGINDLFIPIHEKNIEKINTKIFNRWGSLVFETDNLNIEWDGKYKGNFVSDGVYFWIINFIDGNGIETMLKGSLTVMK